MASARKMLVAIACLFSASLATAAVPPESRILEGEDAATGQYPWVVSVRLDNSHVGVGSIISDRYILTAAHFLSEAGTTPVEISRVSVRVGSINQFSGGQIVKANSVSIHPSYGNFLNDVALIELQSTLVWSDKISKIDYAAEADDPVEGSQVTVAGWGLQLSGASPYKLQHTSLTVLSSAECEYEAGYGYDSVICLSHGIDEGVCRGDDGTCVVSNNKCVGVVSFAFGTCGTKYPDVSGKVSYFADWITNTIA